MNASLLYQHEPGSRHDSSGDLFESFAAPRTVPSGWDLSELTTSGKGHAAHSAETAAASIDPPAPDGMEHPTTAERDRFPKPNTYPSQWDLSA